MKKRFVRLLSLILVIILTISGFSVASSGLYATEEWKEYYEDYMDDGNAVLLQSGSNETERNISWYTPFDNSKCYVILSENESLQNSKSFEGTFVRTESGDRRNRVTVKNLQLGKTYYYKCITSSGYITDVYNFSTVRGTDFSALYVTDIHVSRKQDEMETPLVHQSYTVDYLVNQANDKKKLDLIISAGDQASYGDRKEYESLVASPIIKSIPFSLCVGNHDRKGYAYKFFNNNPNKYTAGVSSLIGNDYWYVKGDVLFLVYDSNCTAASTHRTFTKLAIEANPDVKWRVAAFHHDMYGCLTEGRLEDSNENRRPVFVPIFDEFEIDIAFLGHSHYWTISNVMYDGEVAESIRDVDSVTDPKGTIVMVSSSINRPRIFGDAENNSSIETLGKAYVTDLPCYNIVDFSEDSIVINSYTLDSEEPFNTFTINKTSQEGGHPQYEEKAGASLKRSALEFLAFFTEFGEGVSAIWKCYFDT